MLHSKYTPPAQPACFGEILIILKHHSFFLRVESFLFLLSLGLVFSVKAEEKKRNSKYHERADQVHKHMCCLHALLKDKSTPSDMFNDPESITQMEFYHLLYLSPSNSVPLADVK